MKNRKQIGNQGELVAIQYLERSGYQILEKNYRIGRGEIDIIAIREDLLVFAEVKTRSYHYYSLVEDKVSWYQRQKIKQTASRYLNGKHWMGAVRLDVLLVFLGESGSVQHLKGYLGQL